jgi:hypothetical protein
MKWSRHRMILDVWCVGGRIEILSTFFFFDTHKRRVRERESENKISSLSSYLSCMLVLPLLMRSMMGCVWVFVRRNKQSIRCKKRRTIHSWKNKADIKEEKKSCCLWFLRTIENDDGIQLKDTYCWHQHWKKNNRQIIND